MILPLIPIIVAPTSTRPQGRGCLCRTDSVGAQGPDCLYRLGSGPRGRQEDEVGAEGARGEEFVNEALADAKTNAAVVRGNLVSANSRPSSSARNVSYLLAPVMRTKSCSAGGAASQGVGRAAVLLGGGMGGEQRGNEKMKGQIGSGAWPLFGYNTRIEVDTVRHEVGKPRLACPRPEERGRQLGGERWVQGKGTGNFGRNCRCW